MVKKANGVAQWLGDRDADCWRSQCLREGSCSLVRLASRFTGDRGCDPIFRSFASWVFVVLAGGGYGHPDMLRGGFGGGCCGRPGWDCVCVLGRVGVEGRVQARFAGEGDCRDGERVYGSAGVADWVSVEGRAVGGNGFGGRGLRRSTSDLQPGLLREAYRTPLGEIGYRCASEPGHGVCGERWKSSRIRLGGSAFAMGCWRTLDFRRC